MDCLRLLLQSHPFLLMNLSESYYNFTSSGHQSYRTYQEMLNFGKEKHVQYILGECTCEHGLTVCNNGKYSFKDHKEEET